MDTDGKEKEKSDDSDEKYLAPLQRVPAGSTSLLSGTRRRVKVRQQLEVNTNNGSHRLMKSIYSPLMSGKARLL
ncbi:hypothetical protein EYF80_002488 [Liparis tanakae]|uniref:Uncharacterized protein n=1 Tax=Liparis tanakae TaxID=230148 RepID=A0A4Z2JAU2_9TELE|nr:hypothetical protein EYF80_002488 [Liparis tanakae]